MGSANDFLILFSTTPSFEVADKLATGMVSEKVAACVNILPGLVSIYEWEGKIERSAEYLLIAKTDKSSVDAAFKYLSEHHPYDCPELVAVALDKVSRSYAKWLSQVLT